MIVKKITTGFVIQDYDTQQKRFVSQEFIAGECVYEDEKGEAVDPSLLHQDDGTEAYLPFEMKQPDQSPDTSVPGENKDFVIHELDSTYADAKDRYVVSLIVTYSDKDKDDPKTPEEAVAAALALTTDEGSPDTQWYCFDRVAKKLRMIEQSEV